MPSPIAEIACGNAPSVAVQEIAFAQLDQLIRFRKIERPPKNYVGHVENRHVDADAERERENVRNREQELALCHLIIEARAVALVGKLKSRPPAGRYTGPEKENPTALPNSSTIPFSALANKDLYSGNISFPCSPGRNSLGLFHFLQLLEPFTELDVVGGQGGCGFSDQYGVRNSLLLGK